MKSFIFILLVLAAAMVVAYLVWVQDQEAEIPFFGSSRPAVESSSIVDFGTELQAEIVSFENDMADLSALEADTTAKNFEKDLGSINF